MSETNGHLKLNIGSGDQVTMKGYTNVDAKFGGVAYPLQYGDNTVDEIYASHILEHFPHGQTADVLKDWVRALKPGGVLKVAVPDFHWIANEYLAKANANNYPLTEYLMGGQVDDLDYHKTIFDRHTLERAMFWAGLRDIEYWKSEVNDCASLPVSLNLMGQKPESSPRCLNPLTPMFGALAEHPLRDEFLANIHTGPACGATDGKLLEGVCYHCHPNREQVQDDWDERSSRFLKDARGVIRLGASDGAQREVYGQYGIPVLWVEALPDVCEKLAANVAEYPNNRALCYLLTDADGDEYDFGVASNEGKSSSIFAFADHKKLWPKIHYTHSIKLKSSTFKTMAEREGVDLSAYDALIMDIQGAELKALKGMGDLVGNFQWILTEAADFEMYKGGCLLQELDEYLTPRGFERIQTYPAMGKVGVGQVYDVLYTRKSDSKHFVAGAWRDEKTLTKEKVKVRTGAVISIPRYGPLDAAEGMFDIAAHIGAHRFKTGGCWRGQGRTRAIEHAMAFGDGRQEWEEGLTDAIEAALAHRHEGETLDVFVSMDYDTHATPDHAKALIRLLMENPQYDCIVPTQVRRGNYQEILATFPGEPDYTQPLIPILTGHFGLTVFRRSVFEKLKRPWFLAKPDVNGRWTDGRIDADIYFWNQFNDQGFKAALATQVVIGHGDEAVCWPKFENGKIVKVWQPLLQWLLTRKPPF